MVDSSGGVSHHMLSRCSTALNHYKGKISLHDPVLDDLLQGGFTTKEVSELSGEASSGKTQLCLQLLVHAVCPSGYHDVSQADPIMRASVYHKAVYFYTEGGDPPLDRLQRIALERCGDDTGQCRQILGNIYTEHSFESEEDLIHRLILLEGLLTSSEKDGYPVKVIVVDSIAYLFRDVEIGENNMNPALRARSASFFKIASLLKMYADKYDIAVVLTNHVVDLLSDTGSPVETDKVSCGGGYVESFPGCAGLDLLSSGRALSPALGLSWSSCVNTRLFISKETVSSDESQEPCPVLYRGPLTDMARARDEAIRRGKRMLPQVRGIQVVFSAELPQIKAHFIICQNGCSGIRENDLKNHIEVLSSATTDS